MPLTIEVFNVRHGQCAVITSPNGKRLMIDCGHDSETQWWPSAHYVGQEIEELTVSNYDEDHVSDLVDLMKNTKLAFIRRNTSVGSADLEKLKMETGKGPGIARLQKWMKEVEGHTPANTPEFAPMLQTCYYNQYPADFDDENNLSIVTFIECSGFRAVFPGDLETAGWRKLLERDAFCNELRNINVFLASHHGRDTGRCEEVFDICRPQIVIMSDSEKQFATQETVSWYERRCKGIRYNYPAPLQIVATHKT